MSGLPDGFAHRSCSALTVLLTLLVAAKIGGNSTHVYDLVLAGAVVLAGIPAAIALWWGNGFEAPLAAAVLAALSLGGQVTVAVAGGPGSSGGRWDSDALMVVGMAAAVLILAGVGARTAMVSASRSRRDRPEPPYAL